MNKVQTVLAATALALTAATAIAPTADAGRIKTAPATVSAPIQAAGTFNSVYDWTGSAVKFKYSKSGDVHTKWLHEGSRYDYKMSPPSVGAKWNSKPTTGSVTSFKSKDDDRCVGRKVGLGETQWWKLHANDWVKAKSFSSNKVYALSKCNGKNVQGWL